MVLTTALSALPVIQVRAQEQNADSDTDAAVYGETVVRASQLPKSLTVDEIDVTSERTPGRASVAEILAKQPELHVVQEDRGENKIALRGFEQRQLMILIDGAPFLSPYDGAVDLGKFPAGLVGGIEIVKPHSTTLDIPVGLGGAVNLVTASPGPGLRTLVETEATLPYAQAARASASAGLEDVGMIVSGGYRYETGWPVSGRFDASRNEHGGVRDNSDSNDGNFGAKWRRKLGKHELKALGLFHRGVYGVPPHTDLIQPRYWRWNPWEAVHGQIGHSWRTGDGVEVEERLFVTGLKNELRSYDDGSYSAQTTQAAFNSTYEELQTGLSVGSQIRFDPGFIESFALKPTLSARYMTHESRSEAPSVFGHGMVDEERKPNLSAWRVNGTALGDWRVVKPLGFKAGVLYEGEFPAKHPSDIDPASMHMYGPVAGLYWSPLDTLLVEGSAARRGRFPTFKERYGAILGGNLPNPDLAPEKAWHFGVDLGWTPCEALALRLSGFDSEVDGLIEQVSLGSGRYTIENGSDARLAGAEIRVSTAPVRKVRLDVGYAYLYARKLDAEGGEDRLLYRPAHKLFAGASFEPFDWWEISSGINLIGPQRYQNDLNNRYGTFGAFALWEAGTAFKVACDGDLCFELMSYATNALDTDFQTRYGFPGQGRRVWLSLRLSAKRDGGLGLSGGGDG